MLGLHSLIEHSDITFPITNRKLYQIYEQKLDIEAPNFADINQTISHLCANITLPMCTPVRPLSFCELETNLVPYPRLHFVAPSYAPFLPEDSWFSEKRSLSKIT